jgi:hypothetical protein
MAERKALLAFQEEMGQEPLIDTIRQEAQEPHGKSGQRGKSPTLLQRIHEFDEEQKHKLSCNRCAHGCLVALLEAYLTKANHKKAAVLVEPLVRALTDFNVTMTSQLFTQINNTYSRRFGQSSPEHEAARQILVLQPEERVAKELKASSARVESNRNPIEVDELQVYQVIDAPSHSPPRHGWTVSLAWHWHQVLV